MYYRIVARHGDSYSVYVGHPITWGPSTVHLLLTDPPAVQGRLVEIEIDDIIEEEKLAS